MNEFFTIFNDFTRLPLWGSVVSYFSFAMVCFIPFYKNLTRPMHRIIIELGVFCILYAFIINITIDNVYSMEGIWDWEYLVLYNRISGYFTKFLFITLFFIYARVFISVSKINLVFIFCITAGLISVSNIIHHILYGLIVDLNSSEFSPFNDLVALLRFNHLLDIAINIILFSLLGWIFYRFISPYLRLSNPGTVKKLFIVSIFLYILLNVYYESLLLVRDYNYFDFRNGSFTLIFFILFVASSIYIYIVFYRMYTSNEKRVQIEYQLALQKEHYTKLQENIEKTRQMKHDIRHHLAVFGQLMETSNVEKAREYIAELTNGLDMAQEKAYCKNHLVNAIASHYLGMAEEEGVNVDARLNIPEDTGNILIMDLCIILGNLLENATEACRYLKDDTKKFINVHARPEDDVLFIIIKNSFDGFLAEENGCFMSRKTKMKHEGIGLSSVRAICEKYNGTVDFMSDDEKTWIVSILLRMN